MIKSLVFVTTICSLNVNSFNIQPKEAAFQEETTQRGTYTSNKTILESNILLDDDARDIQIININSYTNENAYITTETTIVTSYLFELSLDQNKEHVNSTDITISKNTYYYTTYRSFNRTNTNIDNIYYYQQDYSNFSDTKGTEYNYNPNSIYFQYLYRYEATNETKAALTALKNSTTYNQYDTNRRNFDNAYDNTTKTNWISSTNTTVNNKNVEVEITAEQLELGYEITTYQIVESVNSLTLAYNNQILNTTQLLDEWYQSYYEIIEGQEVWNYKATSTDQSTINNTFDISIDTHGAQPSEPIDIGGLMWDIIGMPFTFINQAFNVTLFPGSIYEFNIGTLFKGMIAILAVLFVVKLFTKGIDVLGEYTGSMSAAKDRRSNRAWTQEQREMQRENHQMAKEEHNKRMNE